MRWDEFDPYTNLQHGLYVARKLLSKEICTNKQIILVSDGEPTAHFEGKYLYFRFPPSLRTLQMTMKEFRKCTQKAITINTFMLESGRPFSAFVNRMARINKGRVFYTSADNLGQYLDNNGSLWLIGQDITDDLYNNGGLDGRDFLTDYLHVQDRTLGVDLTGQLRGNDNCDVTAGMSFDTSVPAGFTASPDLLQPDGTSIWGFELDSVQCLNIGLEAQSLACPPQTNGLAVLLALAESVGLAVAHLVHYTDASHSLQCFLSDGVSGYKSSHDPKKLKEAYERLQAEYPESEWTKRAYPYRLI